MGCINSTNESSGELTRPKYKLQNNNRRSDTIQEFFYLDEQIEKNEEMCSGPRLATVEAYIDILQTKQNNSERIELPQEQQASQSHINSYTDNIVPGSPSRDLAKLALSLGVITDVQKASTQEDFFAKLNERELIAVSDKYLGEIIEHMKSRVKSLTESYDELNELYSKIDSLFAIISGGTYLTRLEENLDLQLESARETRDKLGSAIEQWRICGLLLRAAAKSATQNLKKWKQIDNFRDSPIEAILLALDCRNTIQASLISLEHAQLSLPNLELKYISNRQTLAVKNINIYMITDIADKSRYDHATKVLEAYENNLLKASSWLYETFEKTLCKDFQVAQNTVKNLSKILREHRHEVFVEIREDR